MPKLLLPRDVTAAERQSGCVWASVFDSASSEIDKGATITGTPTINWGATLNGTTDYIMYPLNGQFNSLTNLLIVCEFYPTFPANDGLSHIFLDIDNGAGANRIIVEKSTANNLDLWINTTWIANIPSGLLLPLWRQNNRNVATFYGVSGATGIRLNDGGGAISPVAWVQPSTATRLTLGCRFSVERFFSGRISFLRFCNRIDGATNDHARIWEGGGA